MRKRGNSTVYPMSHNIKQYNNISLLGITIQGNCKFGLHVKAKFHEANKRLFVIRSLRKEGYTQDEIDHLFNSIEGFGGKRALGFLLKIELCRKRSKFYMQFCLGALNNVLYVFLLKFSLFTRYYAKTLQYDLPVVASFAP